MDEIETIARLNRLCFGKSDQYTSHEKLEEFVAAGGDYILNRSKNGYVLWYDNKSYLMIERIGVLPDARRSGVAKRLLNDLRKEAIRVKRPIRTYVRYDNIPSYLLHMKAGFYPTHVAWATYVWIELDPLKPRN